MNAPHLERQTLHIDLFSLDLTTCGRCTATERNLHQALEAVSSVLREADVETTVEKHVVNSKEQAEHLRMVASPTVRVNGEDIALELRESNCGDCGDRCGCGDGVDCRVWVWKGKEYLEAPTAMIVDAVLRAYFGGALPRTMEEYRLPENLRRCFDNNARGAAVKADAAKLGNCCPEPAATVHCCPTEATPTNCGCS